MATIGEDIVRAATAAADASGLAVADVPLDEIASRAGISRATLYRRIGSRQALEEAVRAAGVEPGSRPDVRERATLAAARLIADQGLGALTLEAVADAASCSVPSIHSQIGGREGLLAAVFERYSPLVRVETIVASPGPSFDATIRAVYAAAFDAATAEPRVLPALLAEVLARPQGRVAAELGPRFVPRVFGSLGAWLDGEVRAGRVRALPIPLLLQLLVGPMVLHVLSREAIRRLTGQPAPPRDAVVDALTAAYCRAVALSPADHETDAQRPLPV